MKYLLINITLILALNSAPTLGQYSNYQKTTSDKINSIRISQFDSLLIRSSILLETHDLLQISDSDHITIIKIINTMNTPRYEAVKSRINKSIQGRFLNLLSTKNYIKEISKLYSWVPSLGMGYYFKKLDVELNGSPNSSSLFLIVDSK